MPRKPEGPMEKISRYKSRKQDKWVIISYRLI